MIIFLDMHDRLEATVTGRVQGVMFRDFVQRKGSGLKLYGIVQNIPDGSVRVVAEGPREKLDKLVEKLHRGPLLARVDTVSTTWKPATGEYLSFKISYAK